MNPEEEVWAWADEALGSSASGYAPWQVSTLGRIRTPKRHTIVTRAKPSNTGRLLITYWTNGNPSTPVCMSIGALVLRTFVGPCPKGYQSVHLNGQFEDCRLSNLAWGPRK